MRIFIFILSSVLLIGCTANTTKKQYTRSITSNKYVQEQIIVLQEQIKNGKITQSYAREKLKRTLSRNVKDNDGSVESILEKIEEVNPEAAAEFEEKIKKYHPEEFKK